MAGPGPSHSKPFVVQISTLRDQSDGDKKKKHAPSVSNSYKLRQPRGFLPPPPSHPPTETWKEGRWRGAARRSCSCCSFCRSALHQEVRRAAWESRLYLTYLRNVSVSRHAILPSPSPPPPPPLPRPTPSSLTSFPTRPSIVWSSRFIACR